MSESKTYQSIKIPNEYAAAHFLEVITMAIKLGCADKLLAQLDYLDSYAQREGCTYHGVKCECLLTYDFAPLSFTFNKRARTTKCLVCGHWGHYHKRVFGEHRRACGLLLDDDKPCPCDRLVPGDDEWISIISGGLVYSGPGCPADGSFPSLTVSCDDSLGSDHNWSVNT